MQGAARVVFHDDLNRDVRDAAARLDASALARAFVAALPARRFEAWSALASFALARTLPEHAFVAAPAGHACRVCGAVERLDAFETGHFAAARSTGIVRTDSLRYTRYDLERFAGDVYGSPNDDDRAFFDLAIARIANVPLETKTFAAEKALGALIPSRIERKLLLGVLGVCGVLDSPERPGFWPGFVPFEARVRLDAAPYTYPVTWWRRSYGVKRAALDAFGLSAYLTPQTLARCGP